MKLKHFAGCAKSHKGRCWRDSSGTEFHPGMSYGIYIRFPGDRGVFIDDKNDLSTGAYTFVPRGEEKNGS